MTPAPSQHAPRRASSFARTVARLWRANVVIILAGLITGPITARALGAEGRGELAAIIAVLTLAPWVLDLGMSLWLGRERALGRSRAELLGAALPVALACSLLGVAAAIPLSHALGGGRPVVVTFLQIGLFLMPVSVVLHILLGLAIGEARWRLVTSVRIVASVLPVIVIVILVVIDQLTVASAAAAYLGGGLVGSLIVVHVVRGAGRPRFDRRRARTATVFGTKSWLSTVAGTANNRLDQVLMAGLVTSRELGFYAVAVTVGSLTSSLIGAVCNALIPRVAIGDGDLAARSCRVTAGTVAVVGVLLAAVTPTMVPFVFGAEFADAVPMVLILLVASVPMASAFVLTFALNAADDPGAAMRAELVALALTVPALIVLLPAYGGIAAALISLVAYGIRLAMQLASAQRVFGRRWTNFIVPTAEDLRWAARLARGLRAAQTRDGVA